MKNESLIFYLLICMTYPLFCLIAQARRLVLFFFLFLFIYDSHREGGAETQAEGEAGSMHREPDVGFDPRSPGSRPGPKAGSKPLRHPGIPGNYSSLAESIQ